MPARGSQGRAFIGFLFSGFAFGCFGFFLSLKEIIIQGGVATRRDPNGEPRKEEKFKAQKSTAELWVGEGGG